MIDPKKLLDDLLSSQVPGTGSTVRSGAEKATQFAKDNPIATGALALAVLGTGPGRMLAGSALKVGGLAAVAGLAYKAYQNYQAGAPADGGNGALDGEILPPPEDTSFHPSHAPQGESEFAAVLIKAMIAAASSDGHIDDTERGRIMDRIKLSGMDSETGAFLRAEFANPADMNELVSAVSTDAQKVELYTASRLAIDPDTRAEKGYLDMLAGRLKLPEALVDHIEATVSGAKA